MGSSSTCSCKCRLGSNSGVVDLHASTHADVRGSTCSYSVSPLLCSDKPPPLVLSASSSKLQFYHELQVPPTVEHVTGMLVFTAGEEAFFFELPCCTLGGEADPVGDKDDKHDNDDDANEDDSHWDEWYKWDEEHGGEDGGEDGDEDDESK